MPSSVGFGDSLDDRDELHEPRAAVVAQEAVHLATARFVGRVHGRENVVFHARGPQVTEAAHDLVEAAAAALRHPVGVVDLLGTVDRDPDEELVFVEELPPTPGRAWFRWSGSCMRPLPGRRYRLTSSTERRKNSTPINVGSPPCQATSTTGTRAWASIS